LRRDLPSIHQATTLNSPPKPLHLLFFLVALLAGCGGPALTLAPPPTEAIAAPEYRIGSDDVLAVKVWQNPELDVSVPVRSDGRITVPLIGDVVAGGRTPEEVRDAIATALAEYVREPRVTVLVTELRSNEYLSRVRVTGAVRTPISLPFRPGMTVLDAVLAAGGPTEFAAADRTALHRRDGTGARSYAVPLGALLEQGDLRGNYAVQPGDVITVPQRVF
jgi:polysaccharide export outer membrane protein